MDDSEGRIRSARDTCRTLTRFERAAVVALFVVLAGALGALMFATVPAFPAKPLRELGVRYVAGPFDDQGLGPFVELFPGGIARFGIATCYSPSWEREAIWSQDGPRVTMSVRADPDTRALHFTFDESEKRLRIDATDVDAFFAGSSRELDGTWWDDVRDTPFDFRFMVEAPSSSTR